MHLTRCTRFDEHVSRYFKKKKLTFSDFKFPKAAKAAYTPASCSCCLHRFVNFVIRQGPTHPRALKLHQVTRIAKDVVY